MPCSIIFADLPFDCYICHSCITIGSLDHQDTPICHSLNVRMLIQRNPFYYDFVNKTQRYTLPKEQMTPAASEGEQSCTPTPLWLHSCNKSSSPLHSTLSSNMFPSPLPKYACSTPVDAERRQTQNLSRKPGLLNRHKDININVISMQKSTPSHLQTEGQAVYKRQQHHHHPNYHHTLCPIHC